MTSKLFSHALGDVGDRYLEEVLSYTPKKKKIAWVRWGILAACFCVVVTGATAGYRMISPGGDGSIGGDISSVYDPSGENSGDYKLIADENGFRLLFDDPNCYQIGGEMQVIVATLSFETMKEFKDAVTKGLLEDWEKAVIVRLFPKDATGAVKICDFDHLYVPKLPAGGETTDVCWGGETYSFGLAWENGITGTFHYQTKESFDRRYQEEYLDFFQKDTVTVTKTETLADGKTVTYYTTRAGELMNVRYTLTSEGQIITVDKTFRLRMENPELTESSEVPSGIRLYGTSSDGVWYASLYHFSADPTDEWLMSFALEEYTEE